MAGVRDVGFGISQVFALYVSAAVFPWSLVSALWGEDLKVCIYVLIKDLPTGFRRQSRCEVRACIISSIEWFSTLPY